MKNFEKRHLANIGRNQQQVKAWYEQVIDDFFKKTGYVTLKSDTFKLSDYPVLEKAVNAAMKDFHSGLNSMLVNGIHGAWDLSREKNASVVAAAYKGVKVGKLTEQVLADRREDALKKFIERKTNGLGLSDRVWKYTSQFRSEIEQALYVGISSGTSAIKMAADMKKYLNEPDKLFRRVRDAKGKLQLSKAARQYNPGPGVYRSSFKNALRLSRNEINFAYRAADQERWQNLPFVLGYEVKLSNNHPKYDVCDRLAGKYPVSFVFRGWHVSCMCYTVPVLATPEQMDAYEDALLNETAESYQFDGKITDVPAGYKKWMKDNDSDLSSGKVRPLWVNDNYKGGKVGKGLNLPDVDDDDEISARIKHIKENVHQLDDPEESALIAQHISAISEMSRTLNGMWPQLQQYKKAMRVDEYRELAVRYNEIVGRIQGLHAEKLVLEDKYAIRAAQLLKAPQAGSMQLTGTRNAHILKGQELFNMIIGNKRTVEGARLPVSVKAGRANYQPSKGIMQVESREAFKTVAHEMGHWLEHKDKAYFEQIKSFYLKRTEGERVARLKDIFPQNNYDPKEIVREDKFINAYTGKIYSSQKADLDNFDSNKQYATEITSMWFTHALSDLRKFIEQDLEHFEFVYRLLQQ